jgi:hypothetical protein
MTLLNPDPTTLQLHSPALGPWFDDNSVTLPLPAANVLDVALTLQGVSWLPPASGLLSVFIATSPRPLGLAGLRGPDGTPAFNVGSFVAVFRLLSWVERRLDALAATIPSAANPATAGVPTRPIVRSLAMELRTPPADVDALVTLLPDAFDFPAGTSTDEERAAHLGLTWDGSAFGNGPGPMSDLLQPGQLFPSSGTTQELLQFPSSTATRLWAFDHRGRPLDAGAVANWWNLLAGTTFTNLWADGVAQRTAPVADGLTFHLVNAHEGPLDAPTARLQLTDATGSVGDIVQRAHANRGVTVAFTNAPTPDDFPQPLAAVLPDGRYTNQAQAWPNGALANLARDFTRIGVLSVEHDLVGQRRTAGASQGAPARRAGDQARNSTGVRPARSGRNALLSGTEATLGALATPVGGAVATTLVAAQVDRDAGPLAPPALAAGPPLQTPPTLTATALAGGGVADGSIVLGQRILVTAQFAATVAGAWVRIWPLGFDPTTGEHIRLDGGAAPVDATGAARVVLPLPDGTVADPAAGGVPPRLGVDLLVVTQGGPWLFPDQRVDRPYPATTSGRIPLTAATPPLLVCATGNQQPGALPNGSVPPGSEVVGLGASPPQLVDRSTIPAAAFSATTVVNLLATGDTIQLTAPAFQTQDADPHGHGERASTLNENGATVRLQDRQPFDRTGFWTAGFPLPGMERLEVVMAQPPDNASGGAGAAVIGSTPLLGAFHELPLHQQGHPGAPGAPDVHGDGVLVTGSASVAVAEYTRDRTITSTVALVTDAQQNPIDEPGVPAANSLWIAGLRTEAAGVASELAYDALNTALGNPYPFDGTWDDVANFLFGLIGALPTPTAAGLVSARRALDRRILTASYGAREGATAIVAAIGRAEDFVYIETPAVDDLTFGDPDDDAVAVWQALLDRMDATPNLHVAVCLPFHLLPGAPAPLQRVRDAAITSALTAMADGERAERFAAFSPAAGPARSLRLANTTIVVDDAIAIVGTTQLWRRGLSFDSSYAASVLDEALLRGRSQEVATFRAAAMAARLGLAAGELPLDPADTIRAIRDLVLRGGFQRLAADRIRPPDPTLTTTDGSSGFTEADVWNPDGSFPGGIDPVSWLLGLQAAVYDDVFNPPPA